MSKIVHPILMRHFTSEVDTTAVSDMIVSINKQLNDYKAEIQIVGEKPTVTIRLSNIHYRPVDCNNVCLTFINHGGWISVAYQYKDKDTIFILTFGETT